MNKLIIGLVGEIASGKDTVAEYLRQKYNSVTVSFSKPLRDILDRLYLPQTRENMVWLGKDLRTRFGEDVLAKAITKEVEAGEAPMFCLANVRALGDIEYFKTMPNFVLIHVDSEPEIRYRRLAGRGQNTDDTTKTWAQFLKDAELPLEMSIREVAKEAHYKITNNGSLEELPGQIEETLSKIKHNYEFQITN